MSRPRRGSCVNRSIVVFLVGAAMLSASCISWRERVTPSGSRCADMLVVGYGKDELLQGRQIHRLRAIVVKCDDSATVDCVDALRKASCAEGGDVVVEAYSEPSGMSGFAARFVAGR